MKESPSLLIPSLQKRGGYRIQVRPLDCSKPHAAGAGIQWEGCWLEAGGLCALTWAGATLRSLPAHASSPSGVGTKILWHGVQLGQVTSLVPHAATQRNYRELVDKRGSDTRVMWQVHFWQNCLVMF